MMVSEPSGFTLLTVKNGSLSENTSHLSRLDPLFNKRKSNFNNNNLNNFFTNVKLPLKLDYLAVYLN